MDWVGIDTMAKMLEMFTITLPGRACSCGDEGAAAVHHAPEVDVHEPVRVGQRQALHRRHQAHASVVDDHVGPAPGLQRGVGQRLHGCDIGHVAGLRQAVGAAGTQLSDHGVEPPGVHVGQQQPSALRGQVSRQRLTDAGGGPGDHHALALEAVHGADCGTPASPARAMGSARAAHHRAAALDVAEGDAALAQVVGDSSSDTRSPARMRMWFLRILPPA
jgi:hypothetical protein